METIKKVSSSPIARREVMKKRAERKISII